MSMHPQPIGPVPEDTARVARAAFPKGNVSLELGRPKCAAEILEHEPQPLASFEALCLEVSRVVQPHQGHQLAEAVAAREEVVGTGLRAVRLVGKHLARPSLCPAPMP